MPGPHAALIRHVARRPQEEPPAASAVPNPEVVAAMAHKMDNLAVDEPSGDEEEGENPYANVYTGDGDEDGAGSYDEEGGDEENEVGVRVIGCLWVWACYLAAPPGTIQGRSPHSTLTFFVRSRRETSTVAAAHTY